MERRPGPPLLLLDQGPPEGQAADRGEGPDGRRLLRKRRRGRAGASGGRPATTFRPYFNKHIQRWQAIVELGRDERGKRCQTFRNTPKDKNTKKEANRIGRQIVKELDAGTYVEPNDMLGRELLESWLEDVVRHRVAARSFDRYRGIVKRHLVPALGAVKLTSLRPDQVQRCYSQLIDAGLSPATVHKVHVQTTPPCPRSGGAR